MTLPTPYQGRPPSPISLQPRGELRRSAKGRSSDGKYARRLPRNQLKTRPLPFTEPKSETRAPKPSDYLQGGNHLVLNRQRAGIGSPCRPRPL